MAVEQPRIIRWFVDKFMENGDFSQGAVQELAETVYAAGWDGGYRNRADADGGGWVTR